MNVPMVVDFEGNVDDDLDFEIANDGASAEWSCSVGFSNWVIERLAPSF